MLQCIIKPFHPATILLLFFFSCAQNLPGNDMEEIEAVKIIKMLNKDQQIDLTNKVITGDLDFTGVEMKGKLHSTLYQSVIRTAVSFTGCIFTGKVICTGKTDDVEYQVVFMQNLIFNNCEFEGIADFQSATVLGNVSFSGSRFKDIARFNSFYSHARASFFGQITAEKEFSIQDALFLGSCNFFKSHFKGDISFQGSRFDGLFDFSTVQCDSRADFSKVRFNNHCTFNYSVFSGIARFNQIRSLGPADFIKTEFRENAIFTKSLFYDICRFNEAKVAAGLDFTSTVFCSSAPDFDQIEIAEMSLFKRGSVIQQDLFALPRINDK